MATSPLVALGPRGRLFRWLVCSAVVTVVFGLLLAPAQAHPQAGSASAAPTAAKIRPNSIGGLDCNGFSRIQHAVKLTMQCADPRGLVRGERFEDNGHYVGHDEPSVRFMSGIPGSGGNVTWREKLEVEPSQLPTVKSPGHDVTHFFELSVAPWFGMALCDSQSFPQLPCTPNSDANAPHGAFPGGGSAFTELQFYPPGFAPIVTAGSCDNTHWCAALLTFSLECTASGVCNNNCIEPVNFAFVQRDGVPTGPPNPQQQTLGSFTPNGKTLLMNPGDNISVHLADVPVGGGAHAIREVVHDATTGQTGFMTASAANGFTHTSIVDCSGTPFNYEPEYNTASPANQVPWAALEGDIFNQFEIGHFIPCNSITGPFTESFGGFTDTAWLHCHGVYEATTTDDSQAPNDDPPCYPKGDTHGGVAPPNLVTGCEPVIGPLPASADLDYDGTSYWPDWPNKLSPGPWPSPFLQQQPTTVGGKSYDRIQFETDAPATEATCQPTGQGCAVPPPGAPGNFYPYWTLAKVSGKCVWEFGQMTNGKTFGADAEYGTPSARFFGTLEGPIMKSPSC
jgi:hypothetical protein